MIRRLLIALLVASATALPATTAEMIRPGIKADHLDTDAATGEQVLTGNPEIVVGTALLRADEIRIHYRKQIATARGHAELTRGPQRILADEIVYRLEGRTFSVKNMRLGEFPLYIKADSAEGSLSEIVATNATLFYREPSVLGPSLQAARLVFQPKKNIRAEKVRVGLGDIRPISLLTWNHDLKDSMLSYLDATAGYRGDLGAYVGIGSHAPVFPGVQAGADLSYFTKRGFLFGPSGTYAINQDDQRLSGSLQSGFIHDNGEKLFDILGRPVREDRSFVDWKHHQTIGDKVAIYGEIHYWKDSEIIRDFIPQQFYAVQQPDSFLEGTYTADNYVVSVLTRVQPNAYHRVQERLPELRFDLLPTPVALGIYQRFSASAAVLREDPIFPGGTKLRSDRLDAYYGLERPIAPREWFNLVPVAGARVTHYNRATGGKSEYTRTLGEVGLDSNLRASGVYAYKNERWGIDGIRHLVTPRISYRYIPEAAKGRRFIPSIDDRVFTTYLQPLGLGDQRAIDDLRATNTLRLGWDNTLQTREKTYGSSDLLVANFAADLDFDPAPGQRDFSAIHTELAFTPVNWLRFDLYQSVTPQDFTLRELNTGFSIHDGDVWSMRISNHYLRRQIQAHVGEGRYRLNESYQTYLRIHYDSRKSRFVEQSFGLVHTISNLWTLRYGISLYDGPRRESGVGFNIEARLAGF